LQDDVSSANEANNWKVSVRVNRSTFYEITKVQGAF